MLSHDLNNLFIVIRTTAKNAMVKEFYSRQGFDKIEEDAAGNTKWRLVLTDGYEKKNRVIAVNGCGGQER